jgi:hypothetical protein
LHGGEVATSISDPVEALDSKTFELGSVDIAVVDYNYGRSRYNGLDLILFLREKGVKEIILFTNALQSVRGLRQDALDAGATAVIAKTELDVFS